MTTRLLVIDDHPGYRLLVGAALRLDQGIDHGIDVVGGHPRAHGAARAALDAQADVALVDALLPDADGFTVLADLRLTVPTCAPILTSAHPQSCLMALGGTAADVAILPKSTAPDRLAVEITAIADSFRRAHAALHTEVALPAERESPRAARRFVASTLERYGLGEVADVVELLVSELVTNAVVHGGSDVDLGIRVVDGRLRVDVVDRSTTWLRRRTADEVSTGGRGTEMVEALATAWGVEARPAGKSVWFELALDQAHP